MSTRSSSANVGQAAPCGRTRACARALVLALIAWTGMPGTAGADAIILRNGEQVEGSIVDATRNTVVVRRAMGGMRQMPIADIVEIRLDLGGGGRLAGQLLGWAEGIHEVRSGGEVVRVSAGRILSRERREPAAAPLPERPRPLAPRPGQAATVKVAGRAATTPEAPRVQPGGLKAATPEVGAAPSRAAGLDAATVPSAGKPPAAVAPAPIAAVPGALAPVGSAVAPVATGGVVPAKVTQAALAPAAAAAPVASPALAAHSKVSPPEADAAKVAAAVVGVPEIAKEPEEQPDQRLAIRGTVDPAAAGAEGIVFRIELSRPAEQAVVLIYGTVDGTAKAGQDYEPQQGIVTLTPGSRKADVLVPLIARPQSRNAVFELFLIADPKVADVIDQRIAATIPGAE